MIQPLPIHVVSEGENFAVNVIPNTEKYMAFYIGKHRALQFNETDWLKRYIGLKDILIQILKRESMQKIIFKKTFLN